MADSSTTYSIGDVVIRSPPYVHVVSDEKTELICDFCMRESTDAKKCTKCGIVRYCRKQCQSKAWRQYHQYECKYYCNRPETEEMVHEATRMILRLIAVKDKKGYNPTVTVNNGQKRSFSSLLSHHKIRYENNSVAMRLLYQKLLVYLGNDAKNYDKQKLGVIGSKLHINSFHIMDKEYNSIGFGLYLGPSIFDHSCQPNATVNFQDKEIYIKVISHKPVKFEDIRISYIDVMQPDKIRRKMLLDMYHFTCACPLCSQPLDNERENFMTGTMVCFNCSNFVIVDLEDYSPVTQFCSNCHLPQPEENVERFCDLKVGFANLNLDFVRGIGKPPKRLMDFAVKHYKEIVKLIHPYDRAMQVMMIACYEHFIEKQNFEDAYVCATKDLAAMIKYYPDPNVLKARQLVKVAKLETLLGKPKLSERRLTEIIYLTNATHEKDHPIYNEIRESVLRQ